MRIQKYDNMRVWECKNMRVQGENTRLQEHENKRTRKYKIMVLLKVSIIFESSSEIIGSNSTVAIK